MRIQFVYISYYIQKNIIIDHLTSCTRCFAFITSLLLLSQLHIVLQIPFRLRVSRARLKLNSQSILYRKYTIVFKIF